jgi:hypothetical protein
MPDVAQLKNVLEGLKFPVPVKKWEIDTGVDSTGDESIWVWAVLDDAEFIDEKRSWPIRDQIRDAIRNAADSLFNGHSPWVYVRFRALSEV